MTFTFDLTHVLDRFQDLYLYNHISGMDDIALHGYALRESWPHGMTLTSYVKYVIISWSIIEIAILEEKMCPTNLKLLLEMDKEINVKAVNDGRERNVCTLD